MEFRRLPRNRSGQRPSIDADDLEPGDLALKGEFDLTDLVVDGGDQIGVSGDGRIRRVHATSTRMSEAILGPVEVDDTIFVDVDLSNASWRRTQARRIEFLRCRAVGWQLELAQAQDVYFEDSRLDYAVIRIEKVKGHLVLSGCTLREAVIAGDLSNVVFADCDLTGAEFQATKAGGCDLRGSELAGTRGLLTMRGATLDTGQASAAAAAIVTDAGLVLGD
ncbi:pentapeptide repeat-containing protein [Amycolatopsis magusensis]|uniref:pentapeptide repeat-containing protein n=1 Tax=Amycolatopsis magusensis TaxID=882444 RepID=UPI003C309A98